MRRTLFLVPTVDLPIFEAGAARDVSRKERARLVGWMSTDLPEAAIEPLLQGLTEEALTVLGSGEMSTKELAAAVPGLERQIAVGSGRWATTVPLSSRLLFLLAMDGLLVRARPMGTWRSSQYRWAATRHWSDQAPSPLTEDEGRTGIASRYIATHGPVTLTDLKWWTGWTMTQARRALSGLDIESVLLDDGQEGLVLAGDSEASDEPTRTVSLLPALDPTVMGWKQRDWYLGPHAGELFDTNGNAGPTVWSDGRVIGGWGQRPDGVVVFTLLEQVAGDVLARIEWEAAELTRWLDGVVVMPRFPSPMGRRLAG